jgi:hypothetical protein
VSSDNSPEVLICASLFPLHFEFSFLQVRKTALELMPPSVYTLPVFLRRCYDVKDVVRLAAFRTLGQRVAVSDLTRTARLQRCFVNYFFIFLFTCAAACSGQVWPFRQEQSRRCCLSPNALQLANPPE